MKNVFLNGGMIGVTMDFNSSDRYTTGQSLATPAYVGGQAYNRTGTTGSVDVSFNLTGGTNSTPQTGDLVVVAFGTASTTDRDLNVLHYLGTNDDASLTEVADLYADDTTDTNLYVGYAFMGAIPATGITLPDGTFSNADGGGVIIQVWRNINSSIPMDATATTVTQTNTGLPDPPSITTVTDGAIIIAIGASGHTSAIDSFSSSELSNFLTAYGSDNYDSTVGMGSYVKTTAGSFNPAIFSATYTDSTAFSAAAITLALRPATIIEYGNYKNSGIWNINSIFYNKSG